MSDLISRQAAIEAIEFGITHAKAINKSTGEVMELFRESNQELMTAAGRINALPSAQPTPCDVCRHNPSSSMDGKPCCVCPAEGRTDETD